MVAHGRSITAGRFGAIAGDCDHWITITHRRTLSAKRGKSEHMKSQSSRQKKGAPGELFVQAEQGADLGNRRHAFRLFLAAAKAGDVNAQSRVGYCYDVGQGVRSDRAAALYWYLRAYRRGDAVAAHNIGTIWRDRRNSLSCRGMVSARCQAGT